MLDRQTKLRDFVGREVYLCQSRLVKAMLDRGLAEWEEIENLVATCIQRGDDLCEGCREGGDCENEEPQEIFEWWAVSSWLAKQLDDQGEPILDSAYGIWWGRTTTGQAIHLDHVVEVIYDTLGRD